MSNQVATGANAQVLIAEESTYGVTPNASEFIKIPFKSINLSGKQDLIENDDLGMGRESQAPVLGRTAVSGDLKVSVDLRNIGVLFKGLLGTPVTTENTGVYTHVFSSGKETLPSFTIEKAFKEVADYNIYNGCKINQMSFDWTPDGKAATTVSVIGQSEEVNSVSAQPTPQILDYHQFMNANGSVDIDGESVEIMSASLALTNNMSEVKTIRADNKISSVDAGMFNATGSVVVRFTDKSLINKAKAGTPVAINLGFMKSANEKLTVKILEAYVSAPGKSIDGPGGIELSFEFQAAQNKAAGKAVEVELVNDKGVY